mmetsp:Transcript_26686/g.55885  ORF Transcript_26686/g.55885 Transcript_26686/m.55885 type:complete len:307 (-) Transcript_26686:104-1024(-)
MNLSLSNCWLQSPLFLLILLLGILSPTTLGSIDAAPSTSSPSMSMPTATSNDAPPTTIIPAVLLDLDGTLLDTETLSDRAMLQALDPWLSHVMQQERSADGGRLPWELKKQILGLRGSEWGPLVIQYAQNHWDMPLDALSPAELWSQWEQNLNNLCAQVTACEGALPLVEQFETAGIPMAIATSSRLEAVAKKRVRHEIMFSKIQKIVTGDHPAVHQGKPAPDIYLEAARQLQLDPSDLPRCLVFEDALSGVRSGKAAGCLVIAVPDPRFTKEEKEIFEREADIVLESLHDFSWDVVRQKLEKRPL